MCDCANCRKLIEEGRQLEAHENAAAFSLLAGAKKTLHENYDALGKSFVDTLIILTSKLIAKDEKIKELETAISNGDLAIGNLNIELAMLEYGSGNHEAIAKGITAGTRRELAECLKLAQHIEKELYANEGVGYSKPSSDRLNPLLQNIGDVALVFKKAKNQPTVITIKHDEKEPDVNPEDYGFHAVGHVLALRIHAELAPVFDHTQEYRIGSCVKYKNKIWCKDNNEYKEHDVGLVIKIHGVLTLLTFKFNPYLQHCVDQLPTFVTKVNYSLGDSISHNDKAWTLIKKENYVKQNT